MVLSLLLELNTLQMPKSVRRSGQHLLQLGLRVTHKSYCVKCLISRVVLLGAVVDLQKVGPSLQVTGTHIQRGCGIHTSVLFLPDPWNMRELVMLLHACLPYCAAWPQTLEYEPKINLFSLSLYQVYHHSDRKLLILISMLYLNVSVMFGFFLQIVAHGVLINPVLGNRGAGSYCANSGEPLCPPVCLSMQSSSLPCDKYQEISQGLFFKKRQN